MVITRALTPTLACIAGVTGKRGDDEDVVVLVAVVFSRGVKTNNNESYLVSTCATLIFPSCKPITSFVTMCIFSYT
jgi:hypothetical protein